MNNKEYRDDSHDYIDDQWLSMIIWWIYLVKRWLWKKAIKYIAPRGHDLSLYVSEIAWIEYCKLKYPPTSIEVRLLNQLNWRLKEELEAL